VTRTDQTDERSETSNATVECSVNIVQTAAKYNTQHRSASYCNNVIT